MRFFEKTFRKITVAYGIVSALVASPPAVAQVAADGVWQYRPQTANRQARYYFSNGVQLHKRGKMKESLVQYDQAIKLDPRCAEFYFRRGDSLLELDKLPEAYADFTKAIELDPRHYPAYKRRARLSYERGKIVEAMRDYKNAEKVCTNSTEKAEIIKLEAKMHSTAKEYNLAIEDFTRSLALKMDPHAIMLRGNQYYSLKDYKRAIADYTEALTHKMPKLQDRLYTMRADAYEKLGKFDLARKDRKSAKSLVDDSWGGVLQDMDKQTKL